MGQDAADDQALPAFTKGETGPHEPSLREDKTKPPSHFTENSLLGAMEAAGKFVEDDFLREALKERGIGTPATRAAIIETLLRRNYIEREKKQLGCTDMGRYLIALIQEPLLKSPEMTGEWEEKLKKIESSQLDPDVFMAGISDYIHSLWSRTVPPSNLTPRAGVTVHSAAKKLSRGNGPTAAPTGRTVVPLFLRRSTKGCRLRPGRFRPCYSYTSCHSRSQSMTNRVSSSSLPKELPWTCDCPLPTGKKT